MKEKEVFSKSNVLFIVLGGFFIANALVAEFIGVKIFSFEKLLGIPPANWSLFGEEGLGFNLTCGVLLWPVVFVMTDIINEYFGMRGVKILSYLTVILIAYAFVAMYLAVEMPPADFWPTSHLLRYDDASLRMQMASEVGNYNTAFGLVLGQGMWIIIGSLVAFLIGQIVDVFVFHLIRQRTGEKWMWLRATGSTLVSQFVDSFVVLIIAFYLGAQWSLTLVLAIGMINYFYKLVLAIVMTPLIYLGHIIIDGWLGKEVAERMKAMAAGEETAVF